MTLQDQGLWTAPRRVPAGVPVDQLAAIEALRTRACRRLVEAAGGDASALGEYLTRSRVLRGRLAATLWPAGTADASEDLLREMRRLEAAARALGVAGDAVEVRIPPVPDDLRSAWRADRRVAPMLEIDALARRLPVTCRLVLFGSLASDREWPAYSDVDLALVIEAAMEGRSLDQVRETAVQLRRAMLRIDPVQHHGPYCLMPSDGEAHLPSLLPVETLRQAVVLGGRSAHLRLRPLPDQVFSIDALLEACDAFERMAAKRRVAGDRYSAKMLGSILLLVPSLLAAAMGRPMEKGESFAWLKREATPDLRNAVVTIEAGVLNGNTRWRRRCPRAW